MDDFDKIIGRKIQKITLLVWTGNCETIEIEKIYINFGAYKLCLEADSDNDELKYKIATDFRVQAINNEYKIIDSVKDQDFKIDSLINKRLIWLWTMINNQGYKDGLQIELDNHESLQFMVSSSFIRIKKLTDIKNKARR